jgi:hypothetical protein
MRKKALKRGELSVLDKKISDGLSRLLEFERSGKASVDDPADIFGELLASIVAQGFEGTEEKLAYKIGYHVGRWIYITDALDDLSDDVEKKRYNPFILLYGENISDGDKALISTALKNELCDAEKAFDLLDFGDNKILENIIYNIFYLGMPRTVERVMSRNEKNGKNEKSRRKKGQFEDL